MGRGGAPGGGGGRAGGGFSGGGMRGMSGGGMRGSMGSMGGSVGRGGGMTSSSGRGGGMGGSMGGMGGMSMRNTPGGGRPAGGMNPGPNPGMMGAGMIGAGMMGAGMARRPAPAPRPVMGGRPAPPPRRRVGCGCLGGVMFPILIILVVVIVLFSSCSVMFMSPGYDNGYTYEGDGITRTKLESNLCKESSQWIDDELGWLKSQSSVRKSMQYFYDQTGVQPYLIITDNVNGEGYYLTDDEAKEYLEDVYDSLYSDEGHMIFLFVEFSPSRYVTYIYTGTAAGSVIDSSAREIMLGIADRYYTDPDLTDDEYFETIFETSADTLMQDYNQRSRTRSTVIIILVIGVIVIIVLILAKRVSDSRAKEAEHTKEILDTPIGQSSTNEDLLKKYGDDSGESKS